MQQRYRVIENIYVGPQGSRIPKSFTIATPLLSGLWFAVASIDGMGTSNRSRAFHDVAWRNLKDAGLPDRIAPGTRPPPRTILGTTSMAGSMQPAITT
ncbi:peptidase [Xanthomonas fragariae LMG 25863]|nr:hypothetical protein BER92_06305 [Xanthomonas fragariae]ENZ94608.1 peptidase [Xanthomonas fragariae LMG 25863]